MISLIKGCRVYAPKSIGIKDVLLAGGRIEGIYDDLKLNDNSMHIEVIDGSEKLMFPGFIDSHVHIIGGGGEGGFRSRTKDIDIKEKITYLKMIGSMLNRLQKIKILGAYGIIIRHLEPQH